MHKTFYFGDNEGKKFCYALDKVLTIIQIFRQWTHKIYTKHNINYCGIGRNIGVLDLSI